MSDKNINVGDEVSWKRGNGNPSATVAEVATSGAIAIESKNGNADKNASDDNPAVHISRGENDVLRRASGLEDKGDGENSGGGNGRETEKKGPETGEKRGRGDADESPEAVSEGRESTEKVEGKGVKKPKTGKGEDSGTKNGSSKTNDSGDKKDGNQEAGEGEPATKGMEREEQRAPKKRGPGRPKKSESKIEKTAAAAKEANNGDSIGKRTRSKA